MIFQFLSDTHGWYKDDFSGRRNGKKLTVADMIPIPSAFWIGIINVMPILSLMVLTALVLAGMKMASPW